MGPEQREPEEEHYEDLYLIMPASNRRNYEKLSTVGKRRWLELVEAPARHAAIEYDTSNDLFPMQMMVKPLVDAVSTLDLDRVNDADGLCGYLQRCLPEEFPDENDMLQRHEDLLGDDGRLKDILIEYKTITDELNNIPASSSAQSKRHIREHYLKEVKKLYQEWQSIIAEYEGEKEFQPLLPIARQLKDEFKIIHHAAEAQVENFGDSKKAKAYTEAKKKLEDQINHIWGVAEQQREAEKLNELTRHYNGQVGAQQEILLAIISQLQQESFRDVLQKALDNYEYAKNDKERNAARQQVQNLIYQVCETALAPRVQKAHERAQQFHKAVDDDIKAESDALRDKEFSQKDLDKINIISTSDSDPDSYIIPIKFTRAEKANPLLMQKKIDEVTAKLKQMNAKDVSVTVPQRKVVLPALTAIEFGLAGVAIDYAYNAYAQKPEEPAFMMTASLQKAGIGVGSTKETEAKTALFKHLHGEREKRALEEEAGSHGIELPGSKKRKRS